MAIVLKKDSQLEKMRVACKITGETLNLLEKYIKVGVSTYELDKIAEEYIKSNGAKPSFKGYGGFPGSICSSINEELIHGIPKKGRILKDGDIISIDVGAYINGYHGDAARTFAVGNVSDKAAKLIAVTKQSFFEGIKFAKEGNYLFDLSAAIQGYVEKNGFSVVRSYVGHGVGRQMHESPQVPNYRQNGKGPAFRRGMTLAVEPMVNEGHYDVKVLKDNWTVVTKDGSLSAHYENTIAVTSGEAEILTLV